MPHKLRQLFKSNKRLAMSNSLSKDMTRAKLTNLSHAAACGTVSHTTSQQGIIPIEIAVVRQADTEAGHINIMLCAQSIKDIIWQCPPFTKIKIAFQNLS